MLDNIALFKYLLGKETSNLTPSEKLVAAVIATHRNSHTGDCFPSIKRIARHCCFSERTVIRATKGLVEKGVMFVAQKKDENSDYRPTNNYVFTLDAKPDPENYKEKYYEYLKSPRWKELRASKLKEAGGRCQMCNGKGKLNVHHRTYDRVFKERVSDLIALCENCHKKFHDIKN